VVASGAGSRRLLVLAGAVIALAAVVVVLLLRTGGNPAAGNGDLVRVHTITVTDPDAELRCQRLGYPCSWSEARDDVFERSLELVDEAEAVMAEHEHLADQLEAAERLLASHPEVVEVSVDQDNLAALMFRVEDGVPVFIETLAAGPVGAEQRDPDDLSNAPAPNVIEAVPAAYRPTQEPGPRQRDALVFDPYSDVENFPEGRLVQATIDAHPHYAGNVRYNGRPGIDDLYGWDGYDIVHVATHGASWCEDRYAFVGQVLGDDAVDLTRCFTWFGWGSVNRRTLDRRTLPEGVTLVQRRGRTRLMVDSEFFVGRQSAGDTIVFLSACSTTGKPLERAPAVLSSAFGVMLGWDGSVYAHAAEAAAVEFWDLMVNDGLELELAIRRLAELGLDESRSDPGTTAALYEELGIDPGAKLVSFGDNRRARDVITAFVDGAEITDGITIPTVGLVGDGDADVIAELTFLVEGVRTGTEDAVQIEVRIDDEVLEPISMGHRTLVEPGEGWADWEVVVEELELPFDLKKGDVDPVIPTDYRWEARVFHDASRYSAHVARPVHFSGTLRAEGRLPIFDELAAMLEGTVGQVTENLLYLEFPSDGGDVSGEFNAVLDFPGGVGYWKMELTGVYEADTGTMQGQAAGEAVGQVLQFSHRDFGSGPFEATVDFAAGVVRGVLVGGDQSQPILAHF
jgi:hypothetical protein